VTEEIFNGARSLGKKLSKEMFMNEDWSKIRSAVDYDNCIFTFHFTHHPYAFLFTLKDYYLL
jgi:hypothetical protein